MSAIVSRRLLLAALAGSALAGPAGALSRRVSTGSNRLPPWTPGTLDIHHIQTGRGNATFVVAPDGTTILIDAGALDPKDIVVANAPLQLAPATPNGRLRPGQWIARYIEQTAPPGHRRIDYAIITHFHADHFGQITATSPWSRTHAFRLSGITDVGELVPIGVLIDRIQPGSGDPAPREDASVTNYQAFARYLQSQRGTRLEPLHLGSTEQIALSAPDAYPDFRILGIKAGSRIMDGRGGTRAAFDAGRTRRPNGIIDENPLSIALRINYGAFAYYAGGDNTGLHEPYAPDTIDTETELAPLIGPVDAMALDHHGNRDATNAGFLAALRPRVIVEQIYTSDQPGGEVVHRLGSRALYPGPRDVFATYLFPATRTAIGPAIDRTVTAADGHVLIRVAPGGASYRVLMLDDHFSWPSVRSAFGPYESR